MATDTKVFAWLAAPALALTWAVLAAVNGALDAAPGLVKALGIAWWDTMRMIGGGW